MSSKTIPMFYTEDCVGCRFHYTFCMGHDVIAQYKPTGEKTGETYKVDSPVIHYAECCLLQFCDMSTPVETPPRYNGWTKCHIIPRKACKRCEGNGYIQLPDIQYHLFVKSYGNEKFTEEEELLKGNVNNTARDYLELVLEHAEKYFLAHMSRNAFNHRANIQEFEL